MNLARLSGNKLREREVLQYLIENNFEGASDELITDFFEVNEVIQEESKDLFEKFATIRYEADQAKMQSNASKRQKATVDSY